MAQAIPVFEDTCAQCYAAGGSQNFSKEIVAEVDGQTRANIHPGLRVRVVEKQNQRTGKLTEGTVQKILTKSPHHPHGIKVMLENGIVGRVKEILTSATP